MRKMGWLVAIVFLCSWTSVAIAAGSSELRKQAEASMLVTGTIDIEPDGSVGGYEIDRAETLPNDAIRLLALAVPSWKFKPVLQADKPVRARTRASFLLVARPGEDGEYLIRVASTHFGPLNEGGAASSKPLAPPTYPNVLAQRGIEVPASSPTPSSRSKNYSC